MNCCQACGRVAPTRYVELYQNVGMLVMRSMRSIKGHLCKRCIRKHALSLTGLTLVTGWWGAISALINPFLVVNNMIRLVASLSMSDGEPRGSGNSTPVAVRPGQSTWAATIQAQSRSSAQQRK